MEHSSVNSNKPLLRRRLYHGGIIFLLCLVTLFAAWNGWFALKTSGVSPAARPSVRAVLKSCFWHEINGGYWENTYFEQLVFIKKMPLSDRISFYQAILLNCDLTNYRATIFVDSIGDDIKPLYQALIDFNGTAEFQKLTAAQRDKINSWIDELKLVRKMNESELHP